MRRVAVAALLALACVAFAPTLASAEVVKYVRYVHQGKTAIGILDGPTIRELKGSLFEKPTPTGKTFPLAQARLLPPSDARKVFAVGMNFASHIASRSEAPPPLFLKLPSSLAGHGSPVTLPPDAGNVHFEGELVLIIGKRAKNVSEADGSWTF